ncbi:MAG: type II toxin-antitoxin system VapC family toxin [Chloroflexota bacterium]|nr:MAG: type II toxin-antitoxin system VapC family toxin [Chloroflexota bacterium]
MSLLLDTSIVIPYLGNIAYDRFLWTRMARQQVYISSVTGMELLAGSLLPTQLSKAEAFIDRLGRQGRIVTPAHEEWLRAGKIVARYQNMFGHVEPADHVHDILILLTAERMGAELATENAAHFRLWSRFRPAPRRPRLVVLDRQAYLN